MYVTPKNIVWSDSTFIFYLSIIITCFIITLVFERVVIKFGDIRFRNLDICLVSIILIFVKGFLYCGRDLIYGYYNNFISATSLQQIRDDSLELGYKFLNVIINNIFHEYWIFVLIVAIITILPIMIFIGKYRDEISVPYAVLFYVSIYFFPSFSVLRIYLASSIGLLVYISLLKKRPFLAFLGIIIASLFHTSMLFLFIPYFLLEFRFLNRKSIVCILVTIFAFVYIERNSLALLFTGRYGGYDSFEMATIGIQQFVYYLPLIGLFFYVKKYINEPWNERVFFSYLSVGFTFGLLGYVISIFGRSQAVFLPIVFIVSYLVKIIEENDCKYKRIIKLALVLYCIMRFWIYISEYYNIDDIMPYVNFFGWSI